MNFRRYFYFIQSTEFNENPHTQGKYFSCEPVRWLHLWQNVTHSHATTRTLRDFNLELGDTIVEL